MELLTTKEVAKLLRTKERKVYELVSQNAIPVSRVTGKLLFPRALVEAWIRRHMEAAEDIEGLDPRAVVLVGSQDPLLDWSLRESGCGIASFCDGSLDGLERLVAGKGIAAGIHLLEPEAGEAWNVEHLRAAGPGLPLVMISFARRQQGLLLPSGNPLGIASVADLEGRRVIPRQGQAGSRVLLNYLLKEAGLSYSSVTLVEPPARSEADVAIAVAEQKADAGIAIESAARLYRLDFLPLVQERFDLAVWRHDYFQPPFQKLLAFFQSETFAEKAESLGGYDISCLGEVVYNAR
jgi:excisionase family DNA binding protein